MNKTLKSLGNRIYLSPNKEVLKDCEDYLKAAQEDIELIKIMDTSTSPIHYVADEVKYIYEELIRNNKLNDVENKELVKSLLEDYAISNIQKSS